MCEVRLKGPVSHTPGGTYSSVPPRAPRRRSMRATALMNAAVLSVCPSPRPPKLATDIHAPRRGGAGAIPEHVSCAPAVNSSSTTTAAVSRHGAGAGGVGIVSSSSSGQWINCGAVKYWSGVKVR